MTSKKEFHVISSFLELWALKNTKKLWSPYYLRFLLLILNNVTFIMWRLYTTGVEKKNDDLRRYFHRKINRWDAATNLLLVEKRQELLRDCGRAKRHYEKGNTSFWPESPKDLHCAAARSSSSSSRAHDGRKRVTKDEGHRPYRPPAAENGTNAQQENKKARCDHCPDALRVEERLRRTWWAGVTSTPQQLL